MPKKKPNKPTDDRIPYVVHVMGQGEPRKVHECFETALEEAKRLAIRDPKKIIRILQIVDQWEGLVTAHHRPYQFPINIPF